MHFSELPTPTRRAFEQFLAGFHSVSPGAAFRREEDPRMDDTGKYVLPFVDTVSGTKYEVPISAEGATGAVLVLKALR